MSHTKFLEGEVDGMHCDLGCVKGMLDEEKQFGQGNTQKLSAADERIKALEKELVAKRDLNVSMQEECNNLRRQLEESKDDGSDSTHEDLVLSEMYIAKDTEELLRKRFRSWKMKIIRCRRSGTCKETSKQLKHTGKKITG